jgi:glycerophosphoryl diester phosphodiesterase
MWRPTNARLDWLTARPIAHRGLHDKAADCEENSLAAFAAAATHGFAIECDLQLSADGEAMVFHDDTLNRLTTETGPVINRTADDLQQISYASGQGTIPTLSQLLDLADGDVGLVIELKSHWNGDIRLAARAAELLSRYDGPAALMSFDPAPIAWLADNAPDIVRGIVADGATDPEYDPLPLASASGTARVSAMPPSRGPTFCRSGTSGYRAPLPARPAPLACRSLRGQSVTRSRRQTR